MALTRYGGPEVMHPTDLPDPVVGPDSVLVRVRAAGVNPVDAKIREGYLAGAFPSAFPLVPGWDVAGVVECTGPAVTEFRVGQEVVGYVRKDHIQHGTYAELVAAPIRAVAPKPSSASFIEAAGLPLTGLTAHQALDAAAVGPGDTVLVHAAAGGVGTMAVQLARLRGANVVGTASEGNHEFLRELGAEPVAYGPGLVTRVRKAAPAGVDAVIDLVGGEALEFSFALVADPGRVVSSIDATTVLGNGGRYVFVRPDPAMLAELSRLVDAGSLRVIVAETFPLERAADAHARVEAGHVRGKVILEVS
jgi:NADPH:quinone reductase-like Zn-dependent oxidoreductase